MTCYARDFSTDADKQRLGWQMSRIFGYLTSVAITERDKWVTVEEISEYLEKAYRCRFPEPSVSAQIRNLRKDAKHGGPSEYGYRIEQRRREGTHIAEYRYFGANKGYPEPSLFDRAQGEAIHVGRA